ncbi:MAG: 6-phosphofructokinase [Anaerolineaceae bacterium]|nr:6-phosphofructokinase [Anaerolineaceae bacterium]
MKTIAVMTSGGDSPGMNAAIRAVVRTGLEYGLEVYGIRQGYTGLLGGDFILLGSREVSGILQRGGTILQTARNLEFKTPQGQKKGLRRLNERGIEGLVVIGGDGSLHGALALHKLGFPVVGIPASIDNDIAGTSMSIGVDTALNTIIEALDRIRDTASSHTRAFIIEVMGRSCGYLALISSILGGAEVVSTPEHEVSIENIEAALEAAYVRGKSHAIAIVAEGVSYETTDLVTALRNNPEVGFDVRLSILGHIQRGGNPSAFDRLLASRMGVHAVEVLREGQSGVMVGLGNQDLTTQSIEEVLIQPRPISESYYDLARILSR